MKQHVLLLWLSLLPCGTLAVSPLVIDDADTVDPGRLQLNAGWQFSRAASMSLYSFPVNPVFGLSSRGELGATFGYQWSDSNNGKAVGGITDLTIATKWRLWQTTTDDRFKLSARIDLKLPTASRDRGLGTGDMDLGGFLIATRCWGETCLDWNIGYTANDAERGEFSDDHCFVGQAVRHDLTRRWTLIGETYAIFPLTKNGGSANVHFSGGLQYAPREDFLLSLLVGSAVGRNSPDLTAYCGFTFVF